MKIIGFIERRANDKDNFDNFKAIKINNPINTYPQMPAGMKIAIIKNNMIMILARGSIRLTSEFKGKYRPKAMLFNVLHLSFHTFDKSVHI